MTITSNLLPAAVDHFYSRRNAGATVEQALAVASEQTGIDTKDIALAIHKKFVGETEEAAAQEFDDRADAKTIVAQIGRMNVLGISGGRVGVRETGITLPVAHGYSVTVDLAFDDTYTVRRVFKRGSKVWVKGERTNVYCDEVGEAAYRASCYHDEF
jgi:hypothetical protein